MEHLPELEGCAIRIGFRPALSADSRKLYSKRAHGQPVYAGSFIRKREIVLDQELERKPKELARILTHEIFHFAWVRLSNQGRGSYEALLRSELKQGARGELGWSAESRKSRFSGQRRVHAEGARRRWREYVCESFCDTAAWLYSGISRHAEFTLRKRHRNRRAEWFREAFGGRGIPI